MQALDTAAEVHRRGEGEEARAKKGEKGVGIDDSRLPMRAEAFTEEFLYRRGSA